MNKINLVGINGYIGSGKDTVGKIIQYLKSDFYPNKSFNRFLEKENSDWSPPYTDWEIKKFAGKLKQIASLMTGIPMEKFEDQEFKKTYLGEEWDYYPIKFYDIDEPVYGKEKVQMTVRELLQKLCTEAIRDSLHTNAWVNALFSDYLYAPDGEPLQNWIITDTRFPNEAQAIKDRGGIIVRVNRNVPIYDNNGNIKSFERQYLGVHPSETSLDNWEFDYVLENNGSIDELIEKVDKMLKYFNL